MGNQASKWSDFNKEEQIEACRQYAEDVKKMCDQFLERLNSGEIEEISEPCYEINRKFSTGTSYPNSEFSFQINFGVNGLTKKKKGSEFWPKDTIVADDEIDNGTLLTLNDGQEVNEEVDGVPSQVASQEAHHSHSQEASHSPSQEAFQEASHSQEALQEPSHSQEAFQEASHSQEGSQEAVVDSNATQ